MTKFRFCIRVFCASVVFSLSTAAHSALIGVLPATPGGTDYQAYYDDVADLTWLADANAAGTTMNWDNAMAWAAGLNINGVTGWRLPTSVICSGENCTGSEMGNLFYNVLGGNGGVRISSTHNANYDFFSNVQDARYWSSTERFSGAYYFSFFDGSQQAVGKTSGYFAWAVHQGNVAVSLPGALWLFGSGLIGLLGVARNK